MAALASTTSNQPPPPPYGAPAVSKAQDRDPPPSFAEARRLNPNAPVFVPQIPLSARRDSKKSESMSVQQLVDLCEQTGRLELIAHHLTPARRDSKKSEGVSVQELVDLCEQTGRLELIARHLIPQNRQAVKQRH